MTCAMLKESAVSLNRLDEKQIFLSKRNSVFRHLQFLQVRELKPNLLQYMTTDLLANLRVLLDGQC